MFPIASLARQAATLSMLVFVTASAGANPQRIQALQSDPKTLQSAIERGKQTALFCGNCHGQSGNSDIPEVPNLAGQNPLYILEQMRKFDRGERGDAFMQGLIKVIKENDRIDLALFYAAAAVQPAAPTPGADIVARGKEIYQKRCISCHGPSARGEGTIPRLAAQKASYLTVSLNRYRERNGVRSDPRMAPVAAGLSKDDIAVVVSYLSSLN